MLCQTDLNREIQMCKKLLKYLIMPVCLIMLKFLVNSMFRVIREMARIIKISNYDYGHLCLEKVDTDVNRSIVRRTRKTRDTILAHRGCRSTSLIGAPGELDISGLSGSRSPGPPIHLVLI